MKQKPKTGSVGTLKSTENPLNPVTSNNEIPEANRDTLLLLKQREAELTLITSVQQAIGKGKEMGAIYELVGERIRQLFDAQVTIIVSINQKQEREYFEYAYEDGQRLFLPDRKYDELRKKIIREKTPLHINENAAEVMSQINGKPLKPVVGTRMAKSAVYVSMINGDFVIGYVSIQNNDREHAFSNSDVQLLSTLANSMSVALENARLFNEAEQRNAELAVINSVQEGLAAEMDMQGIYDLVGDQIRQLFDAQVAVVATFNFENQTEEFQYIFEDGERFNMEPRPIDKVRQRLIDTQDLLCINENADEVWTEITGEAPTVVPGTKLTKSALYVPMKVGNEVRGYVSLQNLDRENAFSKSDIQLLTTLTNSMSLALENARLFNEAEQRNAELAVINSVQDGLAKELDIQGIYDLVGDTVQTLFNAQAVIISIFDSTYDTEFFNYIFENGEKVKLMPRPISKLRKILIDRMHTIYIATQEQAKRDFGVTALGETKMPKSLLFVPLLTGTVIRGYVSLQNIDVENAFSKADIRLLETLANSMSVALENARLFSETEQRNAELAVINSVQQGLVAEMDMQGIYDLVGNKTRELFDSQVTVIATFDHENQKELFNYVFEDGKRFYPEARVFDNIRTQLIKKNKLISISENALEAVKKLGVSLEAAPGTKFPKTMVYVPLAVGDTVRGYVSLQNLDREHAFSDSDIRLLSTLANSMSVALENARLFNEAEQRNAELAVINSVQQGLVAEMDMQGIYDLVGDKTRELFDSQVTVIATFDHEHHNELFNYAFEDGKRFHLKPRPLDKIRERLIKTKKLIDIRENAEEAYTTITGKSPESAPGTTFAKSMVFIPLVVGDTVRGYVSLQNIDREHAFSNADIRLLSTLANSMSVALENARLYNEAEQRNAELAVINSVQQGLVAEMDMQGIYDLVGDRVRDLFDAQVTGIVTFNHEDKTEEFRYLFEDGDRLFPSARLYDKVRIKIIEDRKTLLINERASFVLSEILGQTHKPVPGTRAAKSAVYVPMVVGETVYGYVTLQNLDKENAYSDSDVSILETLVNSMTVALENARLFNETEQRNAELAVINSVQQGLVAEMDMQGIYDLVGNKIRDLFDAQVTVIRTFNHKDKLESYEYAFEKGNRLKVAPRPIIWANKLLIDKKESLLISENYLETAKIHGDKGVTEGEPPKSAVFVPMTVGDQIVGSVSLQNVDKENAYSESDVSLLETLVNSMTVALENARLFNETTRLLAETEQRNAELAVINSVQEGLVREMDMESIYSLVGKIICDVLNTQTLIIRTFDHKKGNENWEFAIENGERMYVEARPFIWANKHLIKSKESLLINKNYIETAKEYGDTLGGVTKGLAPKSAIFVPMMLGGNVIGSVSLQNVLEEDAFTESDLRLLNTLTNSMSVALENARLFNETTRLLAETEQRASEMQTVNNISRALVSQLEFDALINLVGEQMRETFKADIVYLALHDIESNMLDFPYYYGDHAKSKPFGNGITEKIILSKEPILINHNLDEVYDKIKADKIGKIVESYLGVPIISGDKSIGVISVQSTEQENRFTDNDLRLLNTIAANIGVAMQNAEAYRKLQAALTDLKSAQEQLVQQEKLASLGQLAAGIAHEIKNPLNFVNNFSELNVELIDEVFAELKHLEQNKATEQIDDILTDVRSNLKKIHQHGTRADSIVKSMLQHSRGGSGKIEPTNLNELIREYVNLSFHGMRASKKAINVSIDLKLDDGVTNVPLIKEDFSRVILNLCNNAFDAMREKNNSVNEKENFLPKLTVRTYSKNKQVYLEIEDNGPGIPESLKDKILQPFFTTKKGTDGTGLGLSITNDIIKAHGGILTIDSKSGNDSFTKINVQLPS